MSSEVKTCQCTCEVKDVQCVCTCTISADQEGQTEWVCECSCGNGQKCVNKFTLKWGQPADEAARRETDTFTCQCKCGPDGATCIFNIVKPKHCSVTCVDCGVESVSGGQCCGGQKKCCK